MIKTFAQWVEEYLAAYPAASAETMQYLYDIYLLSMGVGILAVGLVSFDQFNAIGGPTFMQFTEEQRRTFYKNYIAGGPSTLSLYTGNPFATITGRPPAPTSPVNEASAPAVAPKPVEVVKPVSKPPLWQFWNWGKRFKRFGWR